MQSECKDEKNRYLTNFFCFLSNSVILLKNRQLFIFIMIYILSKNLETTLDAHLMKISKQNNYLDTNLTNIWRYLSNY